MAGRCCGRQTSRRITSPGVKPGEEQDEGQEQVEGGQHDARAPPPTARPTARAGTPWPYATTRRPGRRTTPSTRWPARTATQAAETGGVREGGRVDTSLAAGERYVVGPSRAT